MVTSFWLEKKVKVEKLSGVKRERIERSFFSFVLSFKRDLRKLREQLSLFIFVGLINIKLLFEHFIEAKSSLK